MNTVITIREEQLQDAQDIREVNLAAFGQPDEAGIVDKLRLNCDELLSLVAVMGGRIVGHILFSPVTIGQEGRTFIGMGLAPMAVLPEYQRRGLGAELIRVAIERLRERECPFVIVLGHADYYPRFGFEPASRQGIRCEWDVPDEAFMILILDAQTMQTVSGLAKYRPEFSDAV